MKVREGGGGGGREEEGTETNEIITEDKDDLLHSSFRSSESDEEDAEVSAEEIGTGMRYVKEFNSPNSGCAVLSSVTAVMKKNRVIGTPDYIAPEVICGESTSNNTIDWWSLGVMTYEFIAGIP